MPMTSVELRPGVNVEFTPTLNQAGYSASQFIRFRNGQAEKIGGWASFYPLAVGGVPRSMHAWQDLNSDDHLAVGTTTTMGVITNGVLTSLTPQTYTSNFSPKFSTTAASATVVINDANIANVTSYDAVEFRAPVAIGGIVLSGVYPINLSLSTSSYNIIAASSATLTRANATITAATKANPCSITTSGAHGFSTGDLIYIFGVVGMTQLNGNIYTITSTGANSFTLGVDSSGYTTYTSGGSASPGAVPKFSTTSASATVSVTLQAHGLSAGGSIVFPQSTTVGGVTIQGTYTVVSVSSANVFTISADGVASSTTSAFMNTGQADIIYYIGLGPAASGTGYGIGTYGSGGYGTGTVPTAQTGTPITATDWTFDNWGSTLLSCPEGGGIYDWAPDGGFSNAKLVPSAPLYNGGIFVSAPAQILIAWGSTQSHDIGIDRDPLTYTWSDQLDYTFWTPGVINPNTGNTSQAGSNRIPTGSKIVAGLQAAQQSLLWTDLGLWSIKYLGLPEQGLTFGQTPIGTSCGAIGSHSVGQINNVVMWMGQSNFFRLTGNGAEPIPCTVWDVVFQDLDMANAYKVRACPNTPFNEMMWEYPSASGGTGENDSYVKVNLLDGTWDYGDLARSAWIDQSVLGNPIGATPAGLIYQHEEGYNADGQPISYSYKTGYWVIAEGNDIAFVDYILPDFKYGTFNGSQAASIQVTVYMRMQPNGSEISFGPFTVTSSSPNINLRARGRQMAIQVAGSDLNSFSRLGKIRFRYAVDGRR